MQTKLLLTLLFITILAIIISSGCGGESGTTQVTSLVTPTPNMTDNMAYITIKVKWPEQGEAGKLIMSSEDGQEITASTIPKWTLVLSVKVYNYKDKDQMTPIDFDPNGFLAYGIYEYPYTGGPIKIPIPIKTDPNDPNSNILPALPVKIWAGAYGIANHSGTKVRDPNDPNDAILSTEQYMILKVGQQTANLRLPDFKLSLTPTYIEYELPDYKSNINTNMIADPNAATTPYYTTDITAKLELIHDDTPTPNPVITLTPSPYSTVTSEPTVTATVIPYTKANLIKGRKITFDLQGGGYLSLKDDDTIPPSNLSHTITAETDPNGCCVITYHFEHRQSYGYIKATYQPDPWRSGFKYEDNCTIYIKEPPLGSLNIAK